ncbi:cytochrome C oxidase subunit IV family protein [Shouchella clausii]|uniref:Cytochrome-c oxidase n=1 Tax=Shouchella clausii TaxID=79880 RepID=A0A268P434_SHOCL|nr:cytochrome C oxidase subunit IV family protein [Shouchella clausii]KKI84569.1 cytochrome C oxidase [Shouchella clausii]MDO7267376.1 cytochrome C oxidase subunit IV family protein [Shouchella clausii]MDO7287670.1 cytochrome C oxidase subunit IV family protein [Shouchella clausii]PAD19415.1 cytochrome-c oxidase [Shouchella clausii]PAD48249.1 cytochrome-c oxidase [Shouchella clausii]
MADDHLSKPFDKSAMTEAEKREMKTEIRNQIVVFVLMLFLTVLAFAAVGADIVPTNFAVPFILILAVVQLLLQLLFFMHMKDKDHTWATVFIITGIFVTVPTIVSLMLLIGIVKY